MENIVFYGGVDNGITGSFCLINIETNEVHYFPTPIKKEKSYTKKEQNISRLNYQKLVKILTDIIDNSKCKLFMERPMVNNSRFFSTLSSIRCLEGTIIALENLGIDFCYLDSKEWQKELLPGIKGRDNLKLASKNLALKLYPQFYKEIKKDGDAILIMHYELQKIKEKQKER